MSRDIDFINTSFSSFTLGKKMLEVRRILVVPKSFIYYSDKQSFTPEVLGVT